VTAISSALTISGYRFALAEIKAILFVLMRNFTFEELASKPVIERKSAEVLLGGVPSIADGSAVS
jgi:cytochrome P450